jgi:hypothetical protein
MRSLLLDTNVLLLLIVGTLDRRAIGANRRTGVFTARDFDLLREELRKYAPVVTTPGVLTEASNLLGNGHRVAAATMVAVCTPFVEVVRPKEHVFGQRGFDRLGFADASILAALTDGRAVLTDDVGLYHQVWHVGGEAINFNHLRGRGG